MAQAAGVSPSQPATQDAEPRTKGSVMATTLVGAHAFEHLYASQHPSHHPRHHHRVRAGRVERRRGGGHPLHLRRHHQHRRRLPG